MRIALAVVVLAVAAVLALGVLAAFNLQVFVDAHRDELVARGERALGRALTIGSVTPSWWPLGIRFGDVVVAEDPRFGAAPFLEAGGVRVAVEPGALVRGRIAVSQVVLERPRIAVMRDAAGRWNVASLGDREPIRSSPNGAVAGDRRREMRMPLVWLGFAASQIRDGKLELEDRSGPVPRRLTASHVRVRTSEVRLGGDVSIRLHAALAPERASADVHLSIDIAAIGTREATQTPFLGHLEVDDADLGTLAVAAGRTEPWSGAVGRVVADVEGTFEAFTVALAARGDGGWRLGPHLPVPRVPMRLDARAQVARDSIRLAEASGAFGSLEWRGGGMATFRPWHLALTVQSLPESTVVLAGRGRPPVRLSALDVTLTADDALHVAPARARIADVDVEATARLAGLDPLVVDGQVHATGFSGVLDAAFDASSAATVNTRIEASGIDLGALLSHVSSRSPALTGRADVSATASLPWSAERPLRALAATGTARLANGSVATLNVAERVLRRMPALRYVPQLVSAQTRGRFPDVFEAPGTELHSATLPFSVSAGVLTIPRVAVTAASYQIKGEAAIDETQAMRFRGDLVLGPELSTALRVDFPALRYLARADGQLVVPFRMSGRLDDPKPEPDLKGARARGLGALLPKTEPADDAVIERLDRLIHP